jgi:hypothetical protein
VPSRTEFQQLADVRVAEAAALLAAGLWDGAYYVAGYAVESALKACILARVERTGILFEDKKFAADCWTHETDKLLTLADLKIDRDRDAPPGTPKDMKWKIVARWNVESRYKRFSQAEAKELYAAITDPTDGVLTWIRIRW